VEQNGVSATGIVASSLVVSRRSVTTHRFLLRRFAPCGVVRFYSFVFFANYKKKQKKSSYKYIDEETATDVPPFTPSTLKENERSIRGTFSALAYFQRLPHGCTKFTYIIRVSLKKSDGH